MALSVLSVGQSLLHAWYIIVGTQPAVLIMSYWFHKTAVQPAQSSTNCMLQAVGVHMRNVCGVCKSVRASVCACACMWVCKKIIGSVHTSVWCSIVLFARSLILSKLVFNRFTSLAVASNFTHSSSRESYSGSKCRAAHTIIIQYLTCALSRRFSHVNHPSRSQSFVSSFLACMALVTHEAETPY